MNCNAFSYLAASMMLTWDVGTVTVASVNVIVDVTVASGSSGFTPFTDASIFEMAPPTKVSVCTLVAAAFEYFLFTEFDFSVFQFSVILVL